MQHRFDYRKAAPEVFRAMAQLEAVEKPRKCIASIIREACAYLPGQTRRPLAGQRTAGAGRLDAKRKRPQLAQDEHARVSMKIQFCIGLVIGVLAGVLFSAAGWTQPAQRDEVSAQQERQVTQPGNDAPVWRGAP